MTTSTTLTELYKRQITLIGADAFSKVRETKVLVVGAGGLGCPVLQYLASAGIGRLGIVDFDRVSLSNLQRQILYKTDDIDQLKVVVAANTLKKLAPFCEFDLYTERLTETNASSIISSYDLVLDCTDNYFTKFLIHDYCLHLGKVLIQASVYQYEGQLNLFDFRQSAGPCLRCLWTEEPLDGCTGTCAEVGVMGPLLGVLGSLQAMEALKVIIGKNHLRNGETMFVDLLSGEVETRRFNRLDNCPSCVTKTFKRKEDLSIDLPQNLIGFVLLDVRSQEEFYGCPIVKSLSPGQLIMNVPLENLASFVPESDKKYLTVCSRGIRSQKACQELRATRPHHQIFSLRGGIELLANVN